MQMLLHPSVRPGSAQVAQLGPSVSPSQIPNADAVPRPNTTGAKPRQCKGGKLKGTWGLFSRRVYGTPLYPHPLFTAGCLGLVRLVLAAPAVMLAAERLGCWRWGCVFSGGFVKRVTEVVVTKRGSASAVGRAGGSGGPVLGLGTD